MNTIKPKSLDVDTRTMEAIKDLSANPTVSSKNVSFLANDTIPRTIPVDFALTDSPSGQAADFQSDLDASAASGDVLAALLMLGNLGGNLGPGGQVVVPPPTPTPTPIPNPTPTPTPIPTPTPTPIPTPTPTPTPTPNPTPTPTPTPSPGSPGTAGDTAQLQQDLMDFFPGGANSPVAQADMTALFANFHDTAALDAFFNSGGTTVPNFPCTGPNGNPSPSDVASALIQMGFAGVTPQLAQQVMDDAPGLIDHLFPSSPNAVEALGPSSPGASPATA